MSSNSKDPKPSKLEFLVEILAVLGHNQFLTVEGIKNSLSLEKNASVRTLSKALTFLERQNYVTLRKNQSVFVYQNTEKGEQVLRYFRLIALKSSDTLLADFEIRKPNYS